jgi:hypothetical protein
VVVHHAAMVEAEVENAEVAEATAAVEIVIVVVMAVDVIQVVQVQVVEEVSVAAVVVIVIAINHVATSEREMTHAVATLEKEMILVVAISVAEMIPALHPAATHQKNHEKKNSRSGRIEKRLSEMEAFFNLLARLRDGLI